MQPYTTGIHSDIHEYKHYHVRCTQTHTHTQKYTCNLYSQNAHTNSIYIKKWPQVDWINYSKLQVGVFGCQTSLSHTRDIVILPHELNMTLNTGAHTHARLRTHICEYMFMLWVARFVCHVHVWAYMYTFAHKCRCAQKLFHLHTQTYKYTSAHTAMYTYSIHSQSGSLVSSSSQLLLHIQTHTHTHMSRQWCITCSGLAQNPLCLCIRCHSGTNVMSVTSCVPYRSSKAYTAACRQDHIKLYFRRVIRFRSEQAHM